MNNLKLSLIFAIANSVVGCSGSQASPKEEKQLRDSFTTVKGAKDFTEGEKRQMEKAMSGGGAASQGK